MAVKELFNPQIRGTVNRQVEAYRSINLQNNREFQFDQTLELRLETTCHASSKINLGTAFGVEVLIFADISVYAHH